MSLAVQTPDQRLTSFAASAAGGRLRLREVAGLERSKVSRERLITRSGDGYFNTDTMIAGLAVIANLYDMREVVRRMTDSKFEGVS